MIKNPFGKLSEAGEMEGAILKSKEGHPVPLTGMDVRGVIDDVMSNVTVTQTYENREKKNIEAVYSFPLPLKGVLLDFTVTIDGKVRHGAVLKKNTARKQYEEAVEQGDTACMLEKVGDGMYSMSVGNILAGQKIEISFRYAQFNIWNGTLLRFFLPTVIAPKYGSSARAGLEEYQAPVTSLTARNAFRCVISVAGGLRSCAISSPTHKVERRETGECSEFAVSAFADRDFILEIRSEGAAAPRAGIGRDGKGYAAAVAMTPDFGPQKVKAPRDLDIIIDCSGSMSGDSIAQARIALKQIIGHLDEADSFNIIRFGSKVETLFREHQPFAEDSLRAAGKLLDRMQADLGGTELRSALRAAYKTHREGRLHDILLITDGEVYENDAFYADAEKSGCRIFVIGVGSAVSEGLLRRLSEATRGMAEFVTPNEDMAEKIVRHFQRMSVQAVNAEIKWPQKPDWVWPKKGAVLFHGDTTVFFARFSEKPCGKVELRTAAGERKYAWSCDLPETADESECSDLARMAVLSRISGRDDDKAADLAVQYRLVTSLTNYLLVEENENGADLDLPEMRTVPQMMPAGYGGLSSVTGAALSCCFAPKAMFKRRATRSADKSVREMCCDVMMKALPRQVCELLSESDVMSPGLVQNLAALDRAGVKSLFGEKTIAALEGLGLEKKAAGKLRSIIAKGVDENVLFILFLNSLLDTESSLSGTVIEAYIRRSFSRLTEQEKNLPAAAQKMFSGLF